MGVTAEDLRSRTKEEFAGEFPEEEDQQTCVDHFEQKRQEVLAGLVAKRQEIIDNGDQDTRKRGNDGSQYRSSLENETSSLIERERKQMEKIKKRQEQEIEQLMEYEMKMQVC